MKRIAFTTAAHSLRCAAVMCAIQSVSGPRMQGITQFVTEQITVRTIEGTAARLDQLSEHVGLPPSELVRISIRLLDARLMESYLGTRHGRAELGDESRAAQARAESQADLDDLDRRLTTT